MYTIKVKYTTGDSERSESASNLLGICWNDIDKAKQALLAIKAHYEYWDAVRWSSRHGKDAPPSIGCYWLCPDKYQMYLFDDNGVLYKISCFWMGYFEQIKSAKIVFDEDEEASRCIKF